MEAGLVTVIVPAFNHQHFVGPCLESIARQSYRLIELIVIDDGSSDGTLQAIRSLAPALERRFVRTEIITKANEGVCKTLNRGLCLARGDFIKFMDSDDVATEDCVAALVDEMSSHPDCGVVYGDSWEIASEDLDQTPPRLERAVSKFAGIGLHGSGDCTDLQPANFFRFLLGASLIRTSLVREIGYFDESLPYQDLDYQIRIIGRTRSRYVATTGIYYRRHGGNLSQQKEIFHRGMEAIIEKYRGLPSPAGGARDEVMRQLSKASGDISTVISRMKGKKLIGWGSGSAYRIAAARSQLDLDYLVDSSPERQGLAVDDLAIRPPSAIRNERAEEIFVLVLSEMYRQIDPQLERLGLRFGKNY